MQFVIYVIQVIVMTVNQEAPKRFKVKSDMKDQLKDTIKQ
jgi:hypothetical protein